MDIKNSNGLSDDNILNKNNNACANLGLVIKQVLNKNPEETAKMAVQEYIDSFIKKNRRLLELASQCNSDEKNKEVKEYLINSAKPEIEKIKSIEGLQDADKKQIEIFEKEIEIFLAQ